MGKRVVASLGAYARHDDGMLGESKQQGVVHERNAPCNWG